MTNNNSNKLQLNTNQLLILSKFKINELWISSAEIASAVAEEAALSKSYAYTLLSRLIDGELIERQLPLSKGRKTMLRLSERGLSVIREHPLLISTEEISADDSNTQINEKLVSNQAFIQAITNLRQSIKQARKLTDENNRIKVENEALQKTLITYLDDLDARLADAIDKTDMSADPMPVEQNSEIRDWFENEWPEAVEKFNEFTNKKALADMIVPSGIVAAFGLCGVVVGFALGVPPVVSFGAGSFIGMFATRQVSTKELGREIGERLDEKDD